jgi:hypothetical protein
VVGTGDHDIIIAIPVQIVKSDMGPVRIRWEEKGDPFTFFPQVNVESVNTGSLPERYAIGLGIGVEVKPDLAFERVKRQ